uniref:Uncharacterized protein n=1 Tax=Arundo donax TaxID=35708 RepID=A0A0A8YCH3_ARUDO
MPCYIVNYSTPIEFYPLYNCLN